jgi:hypothetical protein
MAATLLLLTWAPAWAAKNGDGDLIVSFAGGLNPTRLPRTSPVPVAVRVAGGARTVSGNPESLPQLRRITVEINRNGQLFDRGLPICDGPEIQPSTEPEARRVCGGAIIGSGHVTLQARIASQPPFVVHAKLLAFNGPRRDGHRLILAQAYSHKPPGSFMLTFRVDRREGEYGTVLSTALPSRAHNWAYLTHFDMTLHRIYTYRGVRRSYVSAACGAPAGFKTAVFPFARATYGFANGQQLSLSETGTCRVAGE